MSSLHQPDTMPKIPPAPPESVQKAQEDWRAARIRMGLSLNPHGPTIRLGPVEGAAFARDVQREADAKRAEALETLTIIVNEYGAERVGVWVQNIGKSKGGTK